ncbi:MAG TPA: hypothetical protein VFR97_01210 [Capillimicrobium sp.]|nr:hypothetical protein [Capillimicrobium sp.]
MTATPLTAIFEPVENGWIQARLEEIPAVITVGRDHAEARELLLDAVREYVLSLETPAVAPADAIRERLLLTLR